MASTSNLRTGRHCIFLMHIHLVFVTKYRRKIFIPEISQHMHSIFEQVCSQFEAELKEFNGEADHVHLLVNYPPKTAVSVLVNSLKGVSARHLRATKYPNILQNLYGQHLWSPSYFAGSCGGAPLKTIAKYIQNQNGLKN